MGIDRNFSEKEIPSPKPQRLSDRFSIFFFFFTDPASQLAMVSQKRKRSVQSGNESDSSGYSIVQAALDEEIDISCALAGKNWRSTVKQQEIDVADSDDGLQEMIQTSIAKRNIKGGTEVLK